MSAALAQATPDAAGQAAQGASFLGSAAFWVLLAAAAALLLLCVCLGCQRRRRRAAKQSEPVVIPPTDRVEDSPAPVPASAPLDGAITVSTLHEIGKRSRQEDSLSVSPESMRPARGLLAVLADGMGGLSDGDLVSSRIVSSVMDAFIRSAEADGPRLLCSLLLTANQAVHKALEPSQYGKAGSTLIMGLIRDGRFHYLSVGDSIICLVRGGQVLRLNRAHIYRDEQYLRAVNGSVSLSQCVENRASASLVSFLGMETLRYIDFPAEPVDVLAGDRFMLMSDGVYNALTKRELLAALDGPAADVAARLRQRVEAKNYAGQDNYTAIVLSC